MDNQDQQLTPTPPPPQHMQQYSGFPKLLVSIIVVIFLFTVVSAGAYYLGSRSANLLTQQQILPSPTPIISSTTPTSDLYREPTGSTLDGKQDAVTANWKTYINNTYQFSFNYPPDFIIEDNSARFPPFSIFIWDKSREIPYEGDSKINPYFYVDIKPEVMSLQSYLSKYPNLIKQDAKVVNNVQFTAVEVTQGMVQPPMYLAEKNNRIIGVSNGYLNQGIFDQILSTFKFL